MYFRVPRDAHRDREHGVSAVQPKPPFPRRFYILGAVVQTGPPKPYLHIGCQERQRRGQALCKQGIILKLLLSFLIVLNFDGLRILQTHTFAGNHAKPRDIFLLQHKDCSHYPNLCVQIWMSLCSQWMYSIGCHSIWARVAKMDFYHIKILKPVESTKTQPSTLCVQGE